LLVGILASLIVSILSICLWRKSTLASLELALLNDKNSKIWKNQKILNNLQNLMTCKFVLSHLEPTTKDFIWKNAKKWKNFVFFLPYSRFLITKKLEIDKPTLRSKEKNVT
jgi:hypothetical protein